MSEYTFETAALKAVTIDAVKYNEEGLRNSITSETIQEVVPMTWDDTSVKFGTKSSTSINAVSVGQNCSAGVSSVAIGRNASANQDSVAIGIVAKGGQRFTVSIGSNTKSNSGASVTLGSLFTETVDGQNVTRTCTTDGTGSITIGAGANTLNTTTTVDGVETTVESSNSVTIGCKAENKGADSVVIGAQASNPNQSNVVIGAGANSKGDSCTAIGNRSLAEIQDIAIGAGCQSWGTGNVTIGVGSYSSLNYNVSMGFRTKATNVNAIAIGTYSNASAKNTVALGGNAIVSALGAASIGSSTSATAPNALTFGAQFDETVDGETVTNTCTTEGTGSITIGAGANTLNTTTTVDGVDTVVESSNAVTIGCKAENKGADSVVLGAQAKATAGATVAIGAGATSLFTSSVSLGSNSKTEGWCSTAVGTNAYGANGGTAIGLKATAYMGLAVGGESVVNKYNAMALGGSAKAIAFSSSAIGDSTKASADYATAIGRNATAADYGATVIRSTAEDGTYTQLYFSGANTPLAKKYFPTAWEQKQDVDPETNEPLFDENGEPVMVDDKDKPIAGEAMMGFVAKDKDGNIIARGANMLSALFPYYTGAEDDPSAPTTMSLGGEKPEPVAFHPSDLDMPVEEPTTPEMEEYTPLPVYPIVEPEIEEIDE